MSAAISFQADNVTAPATGLTRGSITAVNVTSSSQSIDLSALIGHYVTIQAVGGDVYYVTGVTAPTVVISGASACLADKAEKSFRVTKTRAFIAYIGAGSVTNGFRYWISDDENVPK